MDVDRGSPCTVVRPRQPPGSTARRFHIYMVVYKQSLQCYCAVIAEGDSNVLDKEEAG